MRLIVLGCIFGHSDNEEIADELWEDKFTLVTMIGDILCIFPFLLRAGYIQPKRIRLEQGSRVLLRIIELLSVSRILRSTKDIPAVKAIRIALSRAIYHLVLPIFFFFSFNVFAAVIAYFVEPCYNTRICPWIDLFDASFYSVVTMTTTGYGNQVPYYLTTRMLSLVIMIFGALFISLPLAIIGNEYDAAWTEVSDAANAAEADKVGELVPQGMKTPDVKEGRAAQRNSRANFLGRKSTEPSVIEGIKEGDEDNEKTDSVDDRDPEVNFNVRLTPMSDTEDDIEDGNLVSNYKHISSLSLSVREEFYNSGGINPTILLGFCELRGWLSSIKWQIASSLRAAVAVKKYVTFLLPAPVVKKTNILAAAKPGGRSRRLSVLGGGARRNTAQVQPIDDTENHSSLELSERSILTRGDSLFADVGRMRTVSDLSDGELNSMELEQLENGKARVGDSGSESESLREPKCTGGSPPVADIASHMKKTASRPTFRSMGTFFRQELEKVGAEEAHKVKSDGIASPLRLPARSLIVMLAKASKDIIPGGSHSTDFSKKMVRAVRNPTSFRSRMWMLLELPSSSREARGLQYVLMFLIMLSVFTLYTQTLTSMSIYGEKTDICGKVVNLYCADKHDPELDPGCFNQNVGFRQKLKFSECGHSNCFGDGRNFGSDYTNYTCQGSYEGWVRPFRTQDQLIQSYGAPNIANTRDDSHRIYAVCDRVECSNTLGGSGQDGNVFWIPLEIVMNVVFSIEIMLRIFVAETFKDFFFDFLNIFDIFSILPFYVEVSSGGSDGLDFAVLASSPKPLILVAMKSLKVFRLFKITRHFRATHVLIETAGKVWRQLIGMLSLLMFIITVFAILLFEVEQGEGCYVGDSNCDVPKNALSKLSTGQFIYLNKQGDLSQYPNALYGLWFSIVTMTSTGYGDMTPSTNAGLVMAVFLMLFGSLYMAMPLTAAASVFYVIHESYHENKERKKGRNSSGPRKKSSTDSVKKKNSADIVHKKTSMGRIIGGGRSTTVTPDLKPVEEGDSRMKEVVMSATMLQKEKELNELKNLTIEFDSSVQYKMELFMTRSTELASKIEQLLKDLQCTDEVGPLIPVMDQAADIIEGIAACVVATQQSDIEMLEKLNSEFFKISLKNPSQK